MLLLLLLLLLSLSASLSLPHTHTLSYYSLCINDNHDQNRKKEHGLPVPAYDSLRVSPGQAFICHHQTLHKARANRSGDTRTTLYFRLTRVGRPKGCSETFLDAMLDPWLETPLLPELAAKQLGVSWNVPWN